MSQKRGKESTEKGQKKEHERKERAEYEGRKEK